MAVAKRVAQIGAAGVVVGGAATAAARVARRRRQGSLERIGREIDKTAAKARRRLERAVQHDLGDGADGKAQRFGRSVDETISEAKTELDRIASGMKKRAGLTVGKGRKGVKLRGRT